MQLPFLDSTFLLDCTYWLLCLPFWTFAPMGHMSNCPFAARSKSPLFLHYWLCLVGLATPTSTALACLYKANCPFVLTRGKWLRQCFVKTKEASNAKRELGFYCIYNRTFFRTVLLPLPSVFT